MNAFALVVRGSDDVVAYACGKCRYVKHSKEEAESCCVPEVCSCGAELRGYVKKCSSCQRAEYDAREAEGLAKAPRVTFAQYDGTCLYHDDEYYSDLDSLLDHCEEEGEEPPSLVWGCAETTFAVPSASDLISDECERQELHEEAAESFSAAAVAELDAALSAWAAKHASSCVSYFQGKIAVDLSEVLAKRAPCPTGEEREG